MKTKDITISILCTLIFSAFLIFACSNKLQNDTPKDVYEVFLNGKSVGLLDSKDEFLALVDNKQQEIKTKYNVEKVYPPSTLKTVEKTTYEQNVKTADEIYRTIEHNEPFTIEGYTVTIKYLEEGKEPLVIQVLNKDDFTNAFYNTISSFIGTKKLDEYKNKTQSEITETGMKITSIYWDEEITIKKNLISTSEYIFTNENDISKYLLFGTIEKQKEYKVKDGDSITKIIEDNQMSIEEFLITNPTITNENALLVPGQTVSVGLISPIVTIVTERVVVEDIPNNYATEYQDDDSLYRGQTKVIQKGSDGLNRVTEAIVYKNGAIESLEITKRKEITPTVNEIIAKGTKTYTGGASTIYINTGTDTWWWPTTSPYKIRSGVGYRMMSSKGSSYHKGIDIAGPGFGSPVRSSTDGVVIKTHTTCPDYGRGYGDMCGDSYGNYVFVSYNDGELVIKYAHMTQDVQVSVGDTLSRGQIIGYMGSSGSSTGAHLHFEIRKGDMWGQIINPCGSVFRC